MLEFAPTGFARSGLWCRADCGSVFRPYIDTVEAIREAAAERDAHEVGVHGYHHVAMDTAKPQWGVTTRGRGGKGSRD